MSVVHIKYIIFVSCIRLITITNHEKIIISFGVNVRFSFVFSSQSEVVALGLPGDNLNLLWPFFQNSKTIEEFEINLT
jgi:hypothetical protein